MVSKTLSQTLSRRSQGVSGAGSTLPATHVLMQSSFAISNAID
jgi:hypothetical protein